MCEGVDADATYEMRRRVIKAKWLLWHGQRARCLERLESVRRNTGWAGARQSTGAPGWRQLAWPADTVVDAGQAPDPLSSDACATS